MLPPGLLHFLSRQEVALTSGPQFGAVSAAALVLSAVGARRRDARAVLVGTAFSAMAALLAIHGLAGPGTLVGDNGVVAFTGAAKPPVGGAVLALSIVPG